MKIGILSYQSACNYGAFLQLLSTVEFIKKQGDEPRVINWIPYDLEKYYTQRSPKEVELYEELRIKYYPRTALCRNSEDIARVIKEEGIKAVIIGSDAVAQYQPLIERIVFPTRRIFKILPVSSHRTYPSPFWGEFREYLSTDFPIVMMSASSQDSRYSLIRGKLKEQMSDALGSFKYISVRDDWTQKMISYISSGELSPRVTPDPVFAFNSNCNGIPPSKEDIIKKFKLPERYVLLSFKKEHNSVNEEWISVFTSLCKKEGIDCVNLPYAESDSLGSLSYSIPRPLSPLDWFSLIKYSSGYVGNNMHPIIVSIHNCTPFFSFDNYGQVRYKGLISDNRSSKIYHIVKSAGLLSNYVYAKGRKYLPPTPVFVLNSLLSFDYDKCKSFADAYYHNYLDMMLDVYKSIKN